MVVSLNWAITILAVHNSFLSAFRTEIFIGLGTSSYRIISFVTILTYLGDVITNHQLSILKSMCRLRGTDKMESEIIEFNLQGRSERGWISCYAICHGKENT